ncbi:Striatin-interacting protein 1 [Paragonimus heterotremus]|uniref:Striatin-interacting protein 1 n=1 Tax=Paragonimus heterotremus TaxID=100268 RepID=A0A8J4WG96_9TREM|nr:Striatin-interacting protein 1 [Paragonimus heterotremus]
MLRQFLEDSPETADDGDVNNDEHNGDIDFVYSDADEYSVEIAELYSYSEHKEFELNKTCFTKDYFHYVSTKWFETSASEQRMHVLRLLDRLDSGKRTVRQEALRAILYLLQGNFGDCELEEDQITWARRNVYLCIDAGLWSAVVQLLLLEIEYDKWCNATTSVETGVDNPENAVTKDSASNNMDDVNADAMLSMSASADLRAILSVLYIMVETVRDGMLADSSAHTSDSAGSATSATHDPATKLREQFCEELASPIMNDSETTLVVVLFRMVHRFCSGLAPTFPMKKVLLLLWKVLLVTLGPITTLFAKKNAVRSRWNLPPLSEDTYQVIRRVRAISPPGVTTDRLLARTPRTNNRHTSSGQGNQAPKQGSLASGRLSLQQQQRQLPVVTSITFSFSASHEPSPSSSTTPCPVSGELPGFATPRPSSPVLGSTNNATESNTPARDGAGTPFPTVDLSTGPINSVTVPSMPQLLPHGLTQFFTDCRTLPWKPKVRQKDLETFLTNARLKFVKFQVPNDTTSLIGLPQPIHEAVRVLREHLYISLGETQIQREYEITRNPMTMGREEIPDTPIERLYRTLYRQLPQFIIALLRVLLTAAPTSNRSHPIDLLPEILADGLLKGDNISPFYSMLDFRRQLELIAKAISAILLLLLKHLKLNHIYQFEYVAQYLVFANCIPLILKFLNHDILDCVRDYHTLPYLDFPSCVIEKPPEEYVDVGWRPYCWRNMFTYINLLRILNMLTKWKHSRTLLLVVFKSAPILKRTLHARHAMLQLYVLKLLKLQSRYFGRQWRKNNMSIMSAIYQKVRHRFTDDWAYGNDVDAAPWRFQLDEHTLRATVDQFNRRRYTNDWLDPEFRPVDNCLTSVLNQPMQLSDEFKRNYEKWLEEEVFSVPINWSQVLAR